ncbi:unnamed protein product, partial [Hymenolepis diminuta]
MFGKMLHIDLPGFLSIMPCHAMPCTLLANSGVVSEPAESLTMLFSHPRGGQLICIVFIQQLLSNFTIERSGD